eukprot:scaffold203161_cov16-Prasinocladus_malaysianus.AAC.1
MCSYGGCIIHAAFVVGFLDFYSTEILCCAPAHPPATKTVWRCSDGGRTGEYSPFTWHGANPGCLPLPSSVLCLAHIAIFFAILGPAAHSLWPCPLWRSSRPRRDKGEN